MSCVRVRKGERVVSMVANQDGGLALDTLKAVFSRATCLSFFDGTNETILRCNNGAIYTSSGTWDDGMTYNVVEPEEDEFTPAVQSASTIPDNIAESVYNRCCKFIYFSQLAGISETYSFSSAVYDRSGDSKFAITVVTKDYAVTAMHCLRKLDNEPTTRDATIGDCFSIYSCISTDERKIVEVVSVITAMDCAILKLVNNNFDEYPSIDAASLGLRAVCLGYPSFEDIVEGQIIEKQVNEREPVPFPVEIAALNTPRPAVFAASCGLTKGFSSGGLFRVYGRTNYLIGICILDRIPPPKWEAKWASEQWLHRRSVSYYASAATIYGIIAAMEEPSPKKKKK